MHFGKTITILYRTFSSNKYIKYFYRHIVGCLGIILVPNLSFPRILFNFNNVKM